MAGILHLLVDGIETPIGKLLIVADEGGRLRSAYWTEYEERMREQLSLHYGANGFSLRPAASPAGLRAAIRGYFDGDIKAIDTLPVATAGTAFQQEVWQALRHIPCGETISYGTLAQRIGRPAAVRAVGLANGANPISIVVPCHRVIGANGTLTGYGGGLERKRWLLAHEQRFGPSPELPFAG
jgi:methylated-DNA-[protein]-cysteine S-methyltransferase